MPIKKARQPFFKKMVFSEKKAIFVHVNEQNIRRMKHLNFFAALCCVGYSSDRCNGLSVRPVVK